MSNTKTILEKLSAKGFQKEKLDDSLCDRLDKKEFTPEPSLEDVLKNCFGNDHPRLDFNT